MPYTGEIRMFAGDYAPEGWALCDGQLLSVNTHQPLYSVIENHYGGDKKNFALPDLRGRVPVHAGLGHGLNHVKLGAAGGKESIVLETKNLPAHTHDLTLDKDAFSGPITAKMKVNNTDNSAGSNPNNTVLGHEGSGNGLYSNVGDGTSFLAEDAIVVDASKFKLDAQKAKLGYTGDAVPVENRQPYIGINFIICLEGDFPIRAL